MCKISAQTDNFEFFDQIGPKSYFWSKTEKVNIIIELCIFKLVLVPNFRLAWKFWYFWPNLPKKGFPGLKQKKWTSHIFYIILLIQIGLVRNLSSNWKSCFFGTNLPKKLFLVKIWKSEHHHWILHIQISLVRNLSSNWQFWFFGPNWPKKVFLVKNWKSEHHHWTLHIQISLGNKFLLQLEILIFLTRFAQTGFFWSKTKIVNTTYILHKSAY